MDKKIDYGHISKKRKLRIKKRRNERIIQLSHLISLTKEMRSQGKARGYAVPFGYWSKTGLTD